MKTMATTLAGMIAISGLVLAGSDHESIMIQFAVCSAGACMFAGGMYWISQIHKGGK